jgi:methyl-accepting chemotaxis protein
MSYCTVPRSGRRRPRSSSRLKTEQVNRFAVPYARTEGCAFLTRLKIAGKLALLLGLSALSLTVAVSIAASFLHHRMMDDRIGKIRAVVEAAIGVAQALEDDVVAGHITREEAISRFRAIARTMRYDNGRGYLIAFNMDDGIVFLVSAFPQLEGTTGGKDPDGTITGSHFIALVKKSGEGTYA